jgi:putative aldouronate transport system substrate-binding protein
MKEKIAVFLCLFVFMLPFAACNKNDDAGHGGPVSITVEVFDRGTDGGKTNPVNNAWTDWIKKKVLEDENINLTFIRINRGEETSALNNHLAAGTAPDICYTYNGDMITQFGEMGGLFDMAPYVDTLLKDYKTFLGPDTSMEGNDLIYHNRDRKTGKMYSIPGRYMYTASLNLFIRKDWLDTLGLPLPQTSQEYYRALAAFKEHDPGKVGKNRVIPFTMTTDVRWTAGIIVDSFIDPALSKKERWINVAVDRNILLPGYKEGFRFLNKMYNNGLIDKDFPIYNSEDIMNNLIKSGVVGSFGHNWDQIYRENTNLLLDLQKNIPGALFVPVDCFQSADGLTHKRGSPITSLNFFIPATCKNPEAAMRYANWLARYENYHFLQVGTEGINHELVNGVPKIKIAPGPWMQNSGGNGDYAFNLNGYDLRDPELNAKMLALSYPWPEEYITEAYRISSLHADTFPVIPVTLNAAGPVSQTLYDKAAVIYVQSVIASPVNFDQVWDAGVNDWLRSGAQAVIDERREKYMLP